MIVRVVRMTFREEAVEEFKHIFQLVKKRILGHQGCTHLELFEDAREPNIFSTISHWNTEEDLNAYRKSELFISTWGTTKSLFKDKPIAFSLKSIDRVEL